MMEMQVGDLGLFYHSSIAEPAAVGICKVVASAHPDATAFEKGGDYYDGRSTPAKPIWQCVDVAFERALEHPVLLSRMRNDPRLVGMQLLKKGSRLSVQPVTPQEWKIILDLSTAAE
jgi:predicted RNA-binding protein with PUA-like domain